MRRIVKDIRAGEEMGRCRKSEQAKIIERGASSGG